MTLNVTRIWEQILVSIDNSKETDQIPAKFLRDGAEVLALLLKNIINWSITLLTFPEKCKIAKLKPIFNKGARADPKIYRPISLLQLVPKIIEKSIHFQIENCLNKKNLMYHVSCMYQSGFRANHSTKFCVTQLIDFVLSGLINRCILAWYQYIFRKLLIL